MPRTPAVGNDGVLGVRRDCARLRATAHLKTPAGRSSLSLFLVPVPAGRPVGGGEEQRKDVAVPVLCFVSSVSVQLIVFCKNETDFSSTVQKHVVDDGEQ